ncbi:PTS sugar transporter subunit IIA [Sinorhizobium fredii]|uniref:PTS sugar transporter subunit IIA n=1 Tax=Rhizobium fredii TaxID=380 RepID=UPI0009B6374D|nr:PTS sugar transporter subunit IIA [Sinorhizobium fredii]
MRIDEFHWERDVIIKARCQDKRSAFQLIACETSERTGIAPSVILEHLLSREAFGATGFGGGFALPHALVPKLRSPEKLLITLRQGIEFEAPDDEPVDVILAILWPQERQDGFLPALARYSRLFRTDRIRRGLRNAGSKTEAMMVLHSFSTPEVMASSRRAYLGGRKY